MEIDENETECTIDYAFQRMGGKHRGKILWFINENTILRYGELKRLLKGITTKMLTQTLRGLEEDGLVRRKVYLQVPPKVEYTLTPSALELIPLINGLRDWADKRILENKEGGNSNSPVLG